MRGLEQEYAGRIEFVRVNVLNNDNAEVMKQFGFSASPELYLVDGAGKVLKFWNEAVDADQLRAALEQALVAR